MEATQTLPVPAQACRSKVKKLLIKIIIYLISEKFSIFAGAIAALIEWHGVCSDNKHMTACGGIVFLIGFIPWAIRETLRDTRQERIGLSKNW